MEIMPGTPEANPNQEPLSISAPRTSYETSGALTWGDAPWVVRYARALSIVGMVFFGFFLFPFLVFSFRGGAYCLPSQLAGLFFAILFSINFQLFRAHNAIEPDAWKRQVALSFLACFFMCPYGTILHAILLSQWFHPQTKAWYGLD